MKRFSFPAGQFLLFTFAVVAAGIKNSHPAASEVLRQQSWSSRKGKCAQRRGTWTQPHSACCDPAERTAQCRGQTRGVCAASVTQDRSVKNTTHSRSGVVCEIWLLQKKGQYWWGWRYWGSTMQEDFWLHTISTDNLTGAREGGLYQKQTGWFKITRKTEECFQANCVILISEATPRTLVLLLHCWTKSNSKWF